MDSDASIISALVALSRTLGDPARDLAILGEGNTSALLDSGLFLVKASGKELRTADEDSFVAVSLERALAVLDGPDLSDPEVREALLHAKVGLHQFPHHEFQEPISSATASSSSILPSVETFLHAYLLSLPGINFVGHTHPTVVNAILCSKQSRKAVSGRLFPDPGLPLARHLRTRVEEFILEHNMPPKVILMENHGFIALGKTPRDVETITSMYVKTARILLGTYALGGPRFLTPENVARIHTRPDEHYRQKQIGDSRNASN